MKDGPDGAITLTLARRQDGRGGHACWSRPAAGRTPSGLGLEALGRRARRPRQDRRSTTSCRPRCQDVYAIGDVTDIKQLAHFASAQGKAAAEIIAGHPAQTNWRAVPAATFTSPEIASVGLTEREAKAEGRTLKIGRFPFRAHGRNIADGETTGFVKLIGDAETDQVLGAHIIGAKASEIIHECSLAIAADLNIEATRAGHPRASDGDRGDRRGGRGRRRPGDPPDAPGGKRGRAVGVAGEILGRNPTRVGAALGSRPRSGSSDAQFPADSEIIQARVAWTPSAGVRPTSPAQRFTSSAGSGGAIMSRPG